MWRVGLGEFFLLFSQGQQEPEGGETGLGFVSGVIGTMTSFLRDNNRARQAIMAAAAS